ncbi:MAG: sulfatase-like hydrolase/transferase [Chloroflexi bacterium]|nr:sulfatase-like hydrolase/transferase [Chloroflexota bacterium]
MSTRPNIVLILADDLGYGDLSRFNGGLSQTPALDALLDEGVCLTQQYTASPVSNPSRATLMTGRYPHRTGSIDTLEWHGLERLALGETTLADVLRRAGYVTGLVGKWHLGSFDPRYHPLRRGFDETVCFRGGMHDYYQWRLEYGEQVVRADGRYLTDLWSDEAVAFIDRHAGEPFFLHVTYNAPHTPLQVPEDEIVPFRERGLFNEGVCRIYAMIRRLDRGVERILAALDRRGLREDTIVVFTSDNGPQFGGQGDQCTTRFNCQYNGAKGTVYEGGIRVPLAIRWPAGLPGARRIDRMAHFADWFPTLLHAAGVPVPAGLDLDGVDLWPVLLGEPGQVCERRFWQWNRFTPRIEGNAAMRDGDWKLVRPRIAEAMEVPTLHWLRVAMYEPEHFIAHGIMPYPALPALPPPPPPELYNVRLDPLERENLAARHPDVARRMLRELETWFEEVESERRAIAGE